MSRCWLFFVLVWYSTQIPCAAQRLTWELGPTGSKASLRGLWAVDESTLWACGSLATVLRSEDGGSTWENCGPEGFDELEFRSIFAWDSQQAIIASAGFPAVILKTSDGGETWREVYRHPDKDAFFDGLKFWPESGAKKGIVFGDPVGRKNHLEVFETEDGGESWQPIDPSLLAPAQGEAGFAASNSAMIVSGQGRVWIGTGATTATRSRLHYRMGWGKPWGVSQVPLPSGEAAGIFSLALGQQQRLLAVGGDYRPGAKSGQTVAICDDGGGWWQAAQKPPAEFRSAVIFLPTSSSGLWITVGPTGSDFSKYGNAWTKFSDQGFHALARGGTTVFAVGADGKFGALKVR